MNPAYRTLALLLFGAAVTAAVALVAVIVRHEHRAGMARIRRASR
jgi:hypothetical protein